MPNKNENSNPILKKQLNAIIALLLVLVGQSGKNELLKNRRASKELVKYLGEKLGLDNKSLASILNTTGSSISNLKVKKKQNGKRK